MLLLLPLFKQYLSAKSIQCQFIVTQNIIIGIFLISHIYKLKKVKYVKDVVKNLHNANSSLYLIVI